MSGQVSRGSVAEYQADERAEVARLRWRVSGKGAWQATVHGVVKDSSMTATKQQRQNHIW